MLTVEDMRKAMDGMLSFYLFPGDIEESGRETSMMPAPQDLQDWLHLWDDDGRVNVVPIFYNCYNAIYDGLMAMTLALGQYVKIFSYPIR